MRYVLPLIFLSISIIGCINQNNQANTSTNSPVDKQKFVWDFSSKKNYVYSFEEITNSVINWTGEMEDIDTVEILRKGDLKVKSKENDKADFVLNLSIENDELKSLKDEIPLQTMVFQDMDANGIFESRHRNSEILFELIFPLPSKDLKVGESEKLYVEIPFNLGGSPLYVRGYNKLKYLGDSSPNTALIKCEFKIDQLNVPKEIKGEFMCSYVGEAQLEFDYKEKYFKSSKVELDLKMKVHPEENGIGDGDMDMEGTRKIDFKFVQIEK